MISLTDLSYWPILVATIINIILGAVWYSPIGFSKLWSHLTGVDMMKMPKKDANKAIGITMISALVQSFVLQILVHNLAVTGVADGIGLGFLLWLGFTGTTIISDTLYARRGWRLWVLNGGFYLIMLCINGAMMSAWN